MNIWEPTTLDLAMRKSRKVEKIMEGWKDRGRKRQRKMEIQGNKRKFEGESWDKSIIEFKKTMFEGKSKSCDSHAKTKFTCFKIGKINWFDLPIWKEP